MECFEPSSAASLPSLSSQKSASAIGKFLSLFVTSRAMPRLLPTLVWVMAIARLPASTDALAAPHRTLSKSYLGVWTSGLGHAAFSVPGQAGAAALVLSIDSQGSNAVCRVQEVSIEAEITMPFAMDPTYSRATPCPAALRRPIISYGGAQHICAYYTDDGSTRAFYNVQHRSWIESASSPSTVAAQDCTNHGRVIRAIAPLLQPCTADAPPDPVTKPSGNGGIASSADNPAESSPLQLCGAAVATVNATHWALVGSDTRTGVQAPRTKVLLYDLSLQTISELEWTLPTGTHGQSVTVAQGRYLVISGGENHPSKLAVNVVDLITGRRADLSFVITTHLNPPALRRHHTSAWQNRIFVWGGQKVDLNGNWSENLSLFALNIAAVFEGSSRAGFARLAFPAALSQMDAPAAAASSELPPWVIPLVVSLAALLALALIVSAVIMCRIFDNMTSAIERLRNDRQFFGNTFQRLRGTFGSRWSSRTNDSRNVAGTNDKPTFRRGGPGQWRHSREEVVPLNDHEDQEANHRQQEAPGAQKSQVPVSTDPPPSRHSLAILPCTQGEINQQGPSSLEPQGDHHPLLQQQSNRQSQYLVPQQGDYHPQPQNFEDEGVDLGLGVFYSPPQTSAQLPDRRSSIIASETYFKEELDQQRKQQQGQGQQPYQGHRHAVFSQIGSRAPVSLDSSPFTVTSQRDQLYLADTVPDEVQRRVSEPVLLASKAVLQSFYHGRSGIQQSTSHGDGKPTSSQQDAQKGPGPGRSFSLRRTGRLNRSQVMPKWKDGKALRSPGQDAEDHASPPPLMPPADQHEEGYVYFTGTGISPVTLVEPDDATCSSYPFVSRPITETVMRGASVKQPKYKKLTALRGSRDPNTFNGLARLDLNNLDRYHQDYVHHQQQLSPEMLQTHPRVPDSSAFERVYRTEGSDHSPHQWPESSHDDDLQLQSHHLQGGDGGNMRQGSESSTGSGRSAPTMTKWPPPPPGPPPPAAWARAVAAGNGRPNVYVAPLPPAQNNGGGNGDGTQQKQSRYTSAVTAEATASSLSVPPPLEAPVPRSSGRVESLYLP